MDPRLTKLADVLVNYSTGVKKGELVRIGGNALSRPLIAALYRAVLKAGGHPVLAVAFDECAEILLADGTDDQLRFEDPLAQHAIETIDVSISMWGQDNTKALSRFDPSRQALVSQTRKKYLATFMRRFAEGKLRWVGTQFPCQAAAQDAEMSLTAYEDFVYRAGLLHLDDPAAAWREISTRQQRVVDHLNGNREIRFVTPGGTDLRLGVEGRKWINCDGHENFPDGEVFTGPIEDATEGVVCYSFPAVHGGREVQNIRLEFRAGHVVDASATKGEEFLIAMLDQDAGARVLGEIAIGTNYSITNYSRNTLFDEKIGGTFHAALGAAYPETGGRNESGLHWDMVCDLREGGKVFADGELISENGRFVNRSWPQPD
ncbi:MAG TPA: aminopeptidase [Pirellulales bacterium]|nr:aminopeptidase [Pirellulales bacterium]